MKIHLNNAKNPSTIYASIRMDRKTYQALCKYMHCSGPDIELPMAKITKRGYGWYRLVATCKNQVIERMAFAIKLLQRFMRDLEPVKVSPYRKVLAYSSQIYCSTHYVHRFDWETCQCYPIAAVKSAIQ